MSRLSSFHLGRRERQIVETLYKLGEGSVTQVKSELSDPPSYSAVRAMLNLLVEKRVVRVRREGKRYIYRAAAPKQIVRLSALKNLVATFFSSAPVDAVAALLDGSAGKLSEDDLQRVRQMIEQAERCRPIGGKP